MNKNIKQQFIKETIIVLTMFLLCVSLFFWILFNGYPSLTMSLLIIIPMLIYVIGGSISIMKGEKNV